MSNKEEYFAKPKQNKINEVNIDLLARKDIESLRVAPFQRKRIQW